MKVKKAGKRKKQSAIYCQRYLRKKLLDRGIVVGTILFETPRTEQGCDELLSLIFRTREGLDNNLS